MKRDIRPVADALARLVRLRGVEFTWDEGVGGRRDVGLIAEEVAEVLPELVRFDEDGVTPTGLNYTHLTAVLVEAIKELAREKDTQLARSDAEIAALRAEVGELRTFVSQLARPVNRATWK